tara:strand:- start:1935 stop:2309 length:375 start_codon:yes stop_codon:yes gene_type:complete
MARWPGNTLNAALACSLILALLLSANARTFSHEPVFMAVVVALHEEETAGHDQSHAEVAHAETDDLNHIFYGHVHDAADHDHNPAFLTPHNASGRAPADSARLLMADTRQWHGPTFDWDRPPRG